MYSVYAGARHMKTRSIPFLFIFQTQIKRLSYLQRCARMHAVRSFCLLRLGIFVLHMLAKEGIFVMITVVPIKIWLKENLALFRLRCLTFDETKNASLTEKMEQISPINAGKKGDKHLWPLHSLDRSRENVWRWTCWCCVKWKKISYTSFTHFQTLFAAPYSSPHHNDERMTRKSRTIKDWKNDLRFHWAPMACRFFFLHFFVGVFCLILCDISLSYIKTYLSIKFDQIDRIEQHFSQVVLSSDVQQHFMFSYLARPEDLSITIDLRPLVTISSISSNFSGIFPPFFSVEDGSMHAACSVVVDDVSSNVSCFERFLSSTW